MRLLHLSLSLSLSLLLAACDPFVQQRLDTLEMKALSLEEENTIQQQEINDLRSQNRALRAELAQVKDLLRR